MRKVIFLFFLATAGTHSSAQLWKEYFDAATMQIRVRNVDSAVFYFDKALLEIKNHSAGSGNHADVLCNYADFCYKIQDFSKAEKLLQEAITIQEKLPAGKDTFYAATINYLGSVYRLQGKYKDSERLTKEAKQIRETLLGKKNPLYAASCFNLGVLYRQMGQLQNSETYYLETIELYLALYGRESANYAYACNNLATVYFDLNQLNRAERLYLESLNTREKLVEKNIIDTKHPDYSQSYHNLGGLYSRQNELEKAEPYFRRAKELREISPGKNSHSYALTCLALGILHFKMENPELAKGYFLEAIAIWEKSFNANHQFVLNTKNYLGNLYKTMGLTVEAEKILLDVLKRSENNFGRLSEQYVHCCYHLATLYWSQGKDSLANYYFRDLISLQRQLTYTNFDFLSEWEKETYINGSDSHLNDYLSFCLSRKYNDSNEFLYNHLLFGRQTILTASLQIREVILEMNDPVLVRKFDEWMNTREQYASLLATQLHLREENADTYKVKADQIEAELTRLSTGFKNQKEKQVTDVKQIRQMLKENEAAIEFASISVFEVNQKTDSVLYIALLLLKNEAPRMIRLFEEREFQNVLKNEKKINSAATINSLYTNSSSLFSLVWEPLEKHLQGVKRIYLAPTGILHQLSFAALRGKEFRVSDKYHLVPLISTVSVTDRSRQSLSREDQLFLYGGIMYDGDTFAFKRAATSDYNDNMESRSLPDDSLRGNLWVYLEGSETEVKNIKSLAHTKKIAVTVYNGWDATEESVKKNVRKQSPQILHFATHGFFFTGNPGKKIVSKEGNLFHQAENPMLRSGLIMAGANYAWENKPVRGIQDGILTSYEISNLYLPNTKLAVLSACKTGLGDIQGSEGVYGLQRAFKLAGVKNLVMSLWDVPDAATAEFMTDFYRNMFNGLSIDGAFYKTQNKMKNKYRKEPYKWAAWILVR